MPPRAFSNQNNHFTAYDLGDIYPFYVLRPGAPRTVADVAAAVDVSPELLAAVNNMTPSEEVKKVP